MELVTLTTVHDVGLASIVRGVLEQAGIETVTAGTSEDVFPVDEAIPIQILVREERSRPRSRRARDLRERARRGRGGVTWPSLLTLIGVGPARGGWAPAPSTRVIAIGLFVGLVMPGPP